MHPIDKPAMRQALGERYPWVLATEHGPRAVDAGECDRCGVEARLVSTCGPIAWAALGRLCAADLGEQAWCAGHGPQGAATLAWLDALPAVADDVARLWWVATGEVRLDPALQAAARRLALPLPGRTDAAGPGATDAGPGRTDAAGPGATDAGPGRTDAAGPGP